MDLKTQEINSERQSERGCVGTAPLLGWGLQVPFRQLFFIDLLRLRNILVVLFGLKEETVFRDASGMGHEQIYFNSSKHLVVIHPIDRRIASKCSRGIRGTHIFSNLPERDGPISIFWMAFKNNAKKNAKFLNLQKGRTRRGSPSSSGTLRKRSK